MEDKDKHNKAPSGNAAYVSARHEIIVEPNRSWLRIPWRELVEYRDLLVLMVRRDFVAKYKQTVLGPLWFIIQPIMTTAVFVVIFSRVAKIPTDDVPPMLFYLCGMMTWNYFSQCLSGTAGTFTSNATLFGKVYFPRLIVPLSKAASGLIGLAIQLTTFLAFWAYFKLSPGTSILIHISPWAICFPLLLLLAASGGIGVGLWLSALTAKYRDFSYISGFLLRTWMYVTPIIYPLSEVPERWRWTVALNPMASVVEATRLVFLGKGTVTLSSLLVSAVVSSVLLLSGALMFNRTERTFIDTV